jgi:GGDEF domain-containing protein
LGEHRLCKAGVEGSIPFVSIADGPAGLVVAPAGPGAREVPMPMAADHVTGLASRGDFETWAARRGSFADAALLIVDVVGLKRVNREQGFLAGDAVLEAAASRLRTAAVEANLVARLGGDELVAIFPTQIAAENALRSLSAGPDDPPLRVGLVRATADDSRESLIERLYATVRSC